MKVTLDRQCIIYLFEPNVDKPPHFDSLTELLKMSFSGKLMIAITSRTEADLGERSTPVPESDPISEIECLSRGWH